MGAIVVSMLRKSALLRFGEYRNALPVMALSRRACRAGECLVLWANRTSREGEECRLMTQSGHGAHLRNVGVYTFKTLDYLSGALFAVSVRSR